MASLPCPACGSVSHGAPSLALRLGIPMRVDSGRRLGADICHMCGSRKSSSSKETRTERLRKHVLTLFHQTSSEYATEIVRTQEMQRGAHGMAGGGIYFAVSPSDTMHKAKSTGVILKARVALGKVKTISEGGDTGIKFTALVAEGYDSIKIPRRGGTEYVVYNYDQVSDIAIVSHR